MLNQIIRGALGERAGARTEVAWPAIDVISLMHSPLIVFFTSVPTLTVFFGVSSPRYFAIRFDILR